MNIMNEERAHTLAEFVDASMKHAIVPTNLPDGVSPDEAAAKLRRPDVILKGLGVNGHYFSGWFDPCGRRVRTAEGEVLFTLVPKLNGNGIVYRLTLSDVALRMLH
jgi:hypothetical protein